MQDFRKYNYTIQLDELQQIIQTAINRGYSAQVIINGEYYNIAAPEADKAGNAAGKDKTLCLSEELPF